MRSKDLCPVLNVPAENANREKNFQRCCAMSMQQEVHGRIQNFTSPLVRKIFDEDIDVVAKKSDAFRIFFQPCNQQLFRPWCHVTYRCRKKPS
eukprot:766966-Hanusia_phi.AAC.2